MLLILSTGYSGTKFVADQFGIDHEPRSKDYRYFWEFISGRRKTEPYVRQMFKGNERECNSNLLPLLDSIEKVFPDVNILHLVRHPKDTVRSLMSGTIFPDEPQRFEKCVDWWVDWHTRLDKYPLLRLEDFKGKPLNVKPKSFPPYEQWTSYQKKYFHSKCDKLIKKYYESNNR